MISYGRQCIDPDDIQAVINVLKGDWITQGPTIEAFENAVARYCGAKFAVAVSSGTAALHLACLAGGLGENDILWTSPNTFVASANCAVYCGAGPDFVDIDPQTYNIGVEFLEEKLFQARKQGRLPKILIPVHCAGQSCDMQSIHALSKTFDFTIIEDASHAMGGVYKDHKVGSCSFSDMTVFSFHPVKIVTTGEGGMILTNKESLYKKLSLLRSHGITKDPAQMTRSDGPWYYQQLELGFNYRMTDIQAALGLSQLTKLDSFVRRRNELALRYNEAFSALPLVTPWVAPDVYSAFHLYVVRLKLMNKTRREVFDFLRQNGIGVHVHYIPVHTQPFYQALGFQTGEFKQAETYYSHALTLPLHPGLSRKDQDKVIDLVTGVLS